jgi:hypothetical protein
VTFRTRTFIIVLLSITVALGVVVTLLSIRTRQVLLAELETRLLAQARLAAVVLEARALDGDLAAEAESLARLTSARVSLIAPDGTLLADSEVRAADRSPTSRCRRSWTATRRGGGPSRPSWTGCSPPTSWPS